MTALEDMEPLLIPSPRQVRLTGGSVDAPHSRVLHWRAPLGFDAGVSLAPEFHGQRRGVDHAAFIDCRLDPSRARDPKGRSAQSYLLHIESTNSGGRASPVTITSGSRTGLRHGLATLVQLLRQYQRRIPTLVISDEPALAHRAVLLDVSRDRVPTLDELLRIAGELSRLKVNHVQLYTEHTFAYAGHEAVWRDSSPITPDDIRTFDDRCRELGIVLAANQNCFGHLAEWLKHDRYRPLAEFPGLEDEWEFYGFRRRGPFSLCPTDPRSLAFVTDLLAQLLPHFSSQLVNINCDETADVGQGRSRGAVAERGKPAVYLEFLRQVIGVVRRHGFTAMFWADIVQSHPETAKQLPEDAIALPWGYEPTSDFASWCTTLAAAGKPFWVCPGTSSWRSITGRTTERRKNLAAAIKAATEHRAGGLMICDWGDVGHRQQWPVALHAIAHAANAAWSGDPATHDPEAESLHVLADPSLRCSQWLDELGDLDLPLRRAGGRPAADGSRGPLLNASAMFWDLHPADDRPPIGAAREWEPIRDHLADIAARVPFLASSQLRDELAHTLAVASFAIDRGIALRGGRPLNEPAVRIESIIASHRSLWLARSRVGGLERSSGYYRGLI